ncbi:MAG: ATP-grasp domain-containing protein [Polynucleobacter sp.]
MINVLVTAIGGGGHGDQILKALRLASEGRYRIFGADAKGDRAQACLVEDFEVLPPASDPSYLDKLLELCQRWEIRALFHGCEAELKLFADQREKIVAAGIFLPINTSQLISLCMNKAALNNRLDELGFKAPQYAVVSDAKALKSIDWFPVVVKPSIGSGGSASVYIAQNFKELMSLADYLGLGEESHNFLIQEYVGRPEDEFTVGVLHDLDGEYIDSIAVRRDLSGGLNVRMMVPNRTEKSELGPRLVISSGISQGIIGKFPELTEQCREIAEALGSKGPLNMQCRFVDGKVRIFEINPRYSGTTSLRAMVGLNEPDLMIRYHLLKETISRNCNWPEAVIERTLTEHIVEPRSKKS